MFRSLYALAGALGVVAAGAPSPPAPGAPFPSVVNSDTETERLAPGVSRTTIRMLTAAGPLVVSLVRVDPRESTVRLATVLANDRIVSKDEPVSSMARRTGAVAGINGDYFDIGGTGAPLGVLVQNGALLRTPSARVALTVTADRTVRFEPYRFAGSVTGTAGTTALASVNEWPPRTGAALLTPAFGPIPSAQGVTLLDLEPLGAIPHRYRVAAVTAGPPWPANPALRLAYGPATQGVAPMPDVGDVLDVAYDTDPPLTAVAAAIGGGPLLLAGGVPIDDPASPNYADRERRIPAAAAARLADGTLALIVVDGRHPATSIGVNRAELIALLRALGASDAMLFDSGGSATLVARVLGDAQASVVNEPSDGVERPVADGLFVYSNAPPGPPAELVVRPERIVALPGARVALQARLVDASLHGLGPARGPWQIDPSPLIAGIGPGDVLLAGTRIGSGDVRARRDGVAGTLHVETVDHVARLVIGPPRANPDPHARVRLTVQAFDARDRPVAVDGLVRWNAHDATVDREGRLAVGDRDAAVSASVGGAHVAALIPVGRHDVELPLFDEAHRNWQPASTPPSAPSAAVTVAGDRLLLAYDFSAGARAVSALTAIGIGAPLAIACLVDGDGNGAALRAAITDRYGDRQTVTFARAIEFRDTRRLSVAIPAALAPPLSLRGISVVGTLRSPAVTAAGSIAIHDCSATVAGAPPAAQPR